MFGIRHFTRAIIDRFDQLLDLLRSNHLELRRIREELEWLHVGQLTTSDLSGVVSEVVDGVDFVADSVNALLIHQGVKPPPTFKSGEQVRCVVTEIRDNTDYQDGTVRNVLSWVSFVMPNGEHGILEKVQCISPALYFRTLSSMFHRDQEITVKIESVRRDGYDFGLLEPSPIQDPPPYAPGDITSAIVRGEDRFLVYSMELPNGEQAKLRREFDRLSFTQDLNIGQEVKVQINERSDSSWDPHYDVKLIPE